MRQHTCPASERDEFVHQWTENCVDTVKNRISSGTTSTPPLLKGCGGNNLSHVYRSLKIEKQIQKNLIWISYNLCVSNSIMVPKMIVVVI